MINNELLVKDKSEGGKSIKVSPFKTTIRKTVPHRHNNYFEIIYLSAGRGYHLIDYQKHSVSPPVVFFVRREQVHGFELSDVIEPSGFVLIVKKIFIDATTDGELISLFTRASSYACLYLRDAATINQLFVLLHKEYIAAASENSPVVKGLLKALLAKLLEAGSPQLKSPGFQHTGLYQSYLELLSMNKPVKNQVAHYAQQLNTTPQNLNAACRKSAGQPAAIILAEFIISEAKRLLLYTNITVNETAFALDFKDNSHFIKYFKKFTGLTPQVYRQIP